MTCGSSEPLVTSGDRCCPCATVAARTQRGPMASGHGMSVVILALAFVRCSRPLRFS
jgi:hypothetical protein